MLTFLKDKVSPKRVTGGVLSAALIAQLWLVGHHTIVSSVETSLSRVGTLRMDARPRQVHHVFFRCYQLNHFHASQIE